MDTYMNCVHCGKSCHKYGLKNHIRYTHEGVKINLRSAAGWNRGLSKSTDERVRRNAAAQSVIMRAAAAAMTPEERKQKWGGHTWSPLMGGLRQGSGRGKKGWYKGYWCDSSWELAWVLYYTDHSLEFSRNYQGFEYTLEGKAHKFYPDFILPSGAYVEIKGWLDARNKAKIEQFSGSLTILGKAEIKPYLQYAEETYGTDFIKLMGVESPYKCADCGTPVSTKRSTRCASCAGKYIQPTKITWPDMGVLREWINSTSYLEVGRRLGVSDKAVSKRIKKYGSG